MNTVIEQMLRKYDSKNIYDQKNAMKEVMQEIVLYGLSRAGFFREAAFYGGTALRIFYGLDRFSEDLDFSLMTSNPNFDLKAYFPDAMAAVFCGKTLESQILYSESQLDQLTGLKNRRGYYEYYEKNVHPYLLKQSCSIVMADIDFFKRVNDTYGHNAGDLVLETKSALC